VVSQIRLPRIFMALVVGIALASAGVIFQGLFRNPMADPFVIGVSAGGAFGAAIGLFFVSTINLLNISITTIFALIGALGTTFLVYTISSSRGKVSLANGWPYFGFLAKTIFNNSRDRHTCHSL